MLTLNLSGEEISNYCKLSSNFFVAVVSGFFREILLVIFKIEIQTSGHTDL